MGRRLSMHDVEALSIHVLSMFYIRGGGLYSGFYGILVLT